ncbi:MULTISPECIES: hypothetical protein [Giesbergeria]|uniref:Uncharacterized protein n=1 Tax=Giesbergeria sinuosa TaxID=80883 RepID=A0ABV9QD60_9BURK
MQDDFGNQLPASAVFQRLVEGDKRMGNIESDVAATRKDQHELRMQITDLLEFFEAMQGAFKVLNWVGTLARPVAAIIALCVTLAGAWSAMRGVKG